MTGCGGGDSGDSGRDNDQVNGSDSTAPTIPANLQATAISDTRIDLSWDTSTDPSTGSGQATGVTGYNIYRCAGSCTPTTFLTTSTTNSYSDTGLTAETPYTYTVSAYDAANNESSQSTSANATTQTGAATYYYVDPDWAGTATGDPSTPWTSLTSSAWTTINTALASGDVTVYFSAREEGLDTEEVSTLPIKLERTDNSTNRFTIDGMSKYNTNDSVPSWNNYSGDLKHVIRNTSNSSIGTFNATSVIGRNYITIRGFFCNPGSGASQGIYLRQFSNGIVEYNKITSQVGHSVGPALILTYDNTNPVNTRSQNVIIRNNIIQDIYGESIYINGCKEELTCSVAQDDILIENNTIIDSGSRGGEPDGIDIKNFITNVVIRGNIIYQTSAGSGRDGITSHSVAIVEQNYIEGMGRNGITFVDYAAYDHHDVALDGGDIRNNIIVNTGGGSSSWQYGILVRSLNGDYDFRNVKIRNNTIYGLTEANSKGIYVNEDDSAASMTGITVENNIVADVNGIEFHATTGTIGTHDYNNFYDSSGGDIVNYDGLIYTAANITDFEQNSISQYPIFVNISAPYAAENFKLQSASPAINAGTTLTGFSDDYLGTTRPQGSAWDIGAYEYEN